MAQKILTSLDLNQNEILNFVEQNLASAPANPKTGQKYYDTTTNQLMIYNGTGWQDVGAGITQATSTSLGGIYADARNSNETQAINIDTATGKLYTRPVTVSAEGLTMNAETGDISLTANFEIPTMEDTAQIYANEADILTIKNEKGAAGGLATLDSTGKVPLAQLPAYVDDVVDTYIVGSTAFAKDWLSETEGGTALTPSTGKIYIVLTSGEYQNKTYRWSGSVYVEISASPGQATETAAGIAAIATATEITAGTDDQKFVTPKKLKTVTDGINDDISTINTQISAMLKKITATNPALTVSGGIATWTVSNSLSSADVICSVKEVSSGDEVGVDITYSASSISIKINADENITAGTYKAVIIG